MPCLVRHENGAFAACLAHRAFAILKPSAGVVQWYNAVDIEN